MDTGEVLLKAETEENEISASTQAEQDSKFPKHTGTSDITLLSESPSVHLTGASTEALKDAITDTQKLNTADSNAMLESPEPCSKKLPRTYCISLKRKAEPSSPVRKSRAYRISLTSAPQPVSPVRQSKRKCCPVRNSDDTGTKLTVNAQTVMSEKSMKTSKSVGTVTETKLKNAKTVTGKNSANTESECSRVTEVTDPAGILYDAELMKSLQTLPEIEHLTTFLNQHEDIECIDDITIEDVDEKGYSALLSAFYCSDCRYTFPQEIYYKSHKRETKCMFPCPHCDDLYSFRNYSQYEKHMKTHSEGGNIKADKRSNEEALTEFNEYFKEKDESFSCKQCSRSYQTYSSLSRHLHIHRTQIICHCGATFRSLEYLAYHQKGVHGGGFVCQLCPHAPSFSTRTSYLSHRNKEHDNKYQCKICQKKYGQQHHLKDHMLTHSESKPTCICNQCGKTYNHPRSLDRHIKSRTCVQRVERSKCSRPLHHSSVKKPGRRAPPVPKPESCKICGKEFPSHRLLKQHEQMHDQSPSHKCNTCGQLFQHVQSYIRHQRNKSCIRIQARAAKQQQIEDPCPEDTAWTQTDMELLDGSSRNHVETDRLDYTTRAEKVNSALIFQTEDNSFPQHTSNNVQSSHNTVQCSEIPFKSSSNIFKKYTYLKAVETETGIGKSQFMTEMTGSGDESTGPGIVESIDGTTYIEEVVCGYDHIPAVSGQVYRVVQNMDGNIEMIADTSDASIEIRQGTDDGSEVIETHELQCDGTDSSNGAYGKLHIESQQSHSIDTQEVDKETENIKHNDTDIGAGGGNENYTSKLHPQKGVSSSSSQTVSTSASIRSNNSSRNSIDVVKNDTGESMVAMSIRDSAIGPIRDNEIQPSQRQSHPIGTSMEDNGVGPYIAHRQQAQTVANTLSDNQGYDAGNIEYIVVKYPGS